MQRRVSIPSTRLLSIIPAFLERGGLVESGFGEFCPWLVW